MNLRRDAIVLLGTLLLLTGWCSTRLSAAPAVEMVARVHWLGLDKISADTNATRCMSVWRLPQTKALLEQTFDKLSRWPSHGATNAASARLRPLLDDLVASEFYLEVAAPADAQLSTANSQLWLAIRLPADRARLWQTNLAAALEALKGTRPVQTGDGWSLWRTHAPERIELARVGEWTLLGLGQGTKPAKSGFVARLPRVKSANTHWLEASLIPSRLVAIFPMFNPVKGLIPPELFAFNSQLSTLNSLNLTLAGEAGNILTRATLDFKRPLDLALSPWEIPTNLLHAPLTSFMAVRDLAPWLAAWPAWQKLQLSPPPDQAYFWSHTGSPFESYFAVPLPAASNQLAQLAGRLVPSVNPWLTANSEGNFQWSASIPGLVWQSALILSPCVKSVSVNQHDFVFGGLYPPSADDPNPPPPEILAAVLGITNLVYYQTEHTGFRIEEVLFITQLFQLVFHKPMLQHTTAAIVWLKNIELLMGDSDTVVIRSSPTQLALTRHSTIGFTALELHLLADWLESPQFPHGLHTFMAPPDQ